MDIKAMVVSDLANDKRLIVDLFQKCGRDELKFIVTTGFWGGKYYWQVVMLFLASCER